MVLISVMMIGLGIVTVLWGRWLLPRQLRRVEARASDRSGSRYDLTQHRRDRILVAAPTGVGTLLVVTGVVLWITS
jgi:hypothetical protein